MSRKSMLSLWVKSVTSSVAALASASTKRAVRSLIQVTNPVARHTRATKGECLVGLAIGVTGAQRYRLYRPSGLKPGETVPLLVMLHGCRQDAISFAEITRMNRVATKGRFLVLYPQQDRTVNAQGCWNWYDTKSGTAYDEASLIMAAIDQVCLQYPADPARIAVAGLSAGASMAALLATRYAGRFKAVIMHSGVPVGSANSTRTALAAMRGRSRLMSVKTPIENSDHLPPLLVIQGKADTLVAAANGRTSALRWAEATNAHEGSPRVVQTPGRYAMTVSDFKCDARTMVQLVSIDQLGHAWSGGAAGLPFSDAQGPDASRMVWAFAAKQFGVRSTILQHKLPTQAPLRA